MPRVVEASGRSVSFADGSEQDVDAVIWATGYRADHSWINAPVLDGDGYVRHRRGVTDVPGLYFLGLSWQHTRGSALLGWVKDDAEFIATEIDAAATAQAAAAPTAAGSHPRSARSGRDREGLHMNMHGHEHHAEVDEHFSTAVDGLPEAVGTEVLDLSDGDTFNLRIAPVVKRLGEAAGADARVQRLDPGPDDEGAAGVGGGRQRHQRRGSRGDRALARLAGREPLRRHG